MKITESQSNNQIIGEIGRRLRERRINLNATQKDIAEQSGISSRTLTNIEEGQNYSFFTLISLLKSLNLIDNINDLVPEALLEPTTFLNANIRKKRKRASKTTKDPESWIWGDEQ